MIGSQELILILAVLLIVFGPKKLPEMAKELARMMQEFNKAVSNVTNVASSALKDEEDEKEMIIKIARNLGIDTEGRSIKQLLEEIERKKVKNTENLDVSENR